MQYRGDKPCGFAVLTVRKRLAVLSQANKHLY